MEQLKKDIIELYSFQRIQNYSEIVKELQKTYLSVSYNDISILFNDAKLKESINDIQRIYNKFNDDRKQAFNNDFKAFYEWFIAQGDKCGYCGITQDELYLLFDKKKKGKLPLNEAFKRSSGTLEIERLNSTSNSYSSDNIILACPLCNNAKSNLIDEANWRKIFVKPMRQYYELLLGEKLKNNIPEYHL